MAERGQQQPTERPLSLIAEEAGDFNSSSSSSSNASLAEEEEDEDQEEEEEEDNNVADVPP